MTEPYNNDLLVKIVRDESVAVPDREEAVEALVARIASEGIALPNTECPDGLKVDVRHRSTVERVIDNPQINREDRREVYFELGPAQSNYPPRGSAVSSN